MTIFHFVGKELPKLTLVSLVIGAIIPDIQGFISIIFDSSIALHGFSHTLVGSLLYTIPYIILIEIYHRGMGEIQGGVFLMSYTGFHLIPDLFIYPDMHILWPFSTFTIGKIERYMLVANILAYCFLLAILISLGKWMYDSLRAE